MSHYTDRKKVYADLTVRDRIPAFRTSLFFLNFIALLVQLDLGLPEIL